MRDADRVPAILPPLDGLRGLAAILILFHHPLVSIPFMYPGSTVPDIVGGAALGVMFFFVLSGLVLFLPVVRKDGQFGSVRAYAQRRSLRILPAYLVALAGLILVIWPLVIKDVLPNPISTGDGWLAIVAHLPLLQHILLGAGPALGYPTGDGFGLNGSLWTLTIEVCFYVVLPLVAARFFRRPVAAFLIAISVAFAWRAMALHLPQIGDRISNGLFEDTIRGRLVTQFPAYLGHFAVGMGAAMVLGALWKYHDVRWIQRWCGVVVVLAALAIVPLTDRYGGRGPEGIYNNYLSDVLPAFAFAVLAVSVCLAGHRVQWIFANRFSRWLGDISYGVYLWHMPLMQVAYRTLDLQQYDAATGRLILLATVVPSSILAGWLSYQFVERPVMQHARRRRALATVPAVSAS
jgi:peptidoglycan/LPS O-acetylase OafA/YrhL